MSGKQIGLLLTGLIIAIGFISIYFLPEKPAFLQSKDEKLARRTCGSCHLYPNPALLDKKTWNESVIPKMAFVMGFPDSRYYAKISPEDRMIVMKVIPQQPMISREELERIRQFYVNQAPERLKPATEMAMEKQQQFDLVKPDRLNTYFVTLVKHDSIRNSTYIGTRSAWLFKLDQELRTTDSVKLPGTPSSILFEKDRLLVSVMGLFDPNDQAMGKVMAIDYSLDSAYTLIDNLQRPTAISSADMDLDGKEDLIVCCFGNYTGGLLVFRNLGDDLFERHIACTTPGARTAEIRDMDGDGTPDLVALLAQAYERISVFYNRGQFQFEEHPLVQFPPVYGSSFFELNDMDGDGDEDIIYTNGDNGDVSPVLKPYHGVRIFSNDGRNHFKESYHFPMYGTSMARSVDFDGDGDKDMVAISFFPDFDDRDNRSIVYLENTGHDHFKPQYEPGSTDGRWLVMDIGDINGDHKPDVLLGACSFRGLGANQQLYNFWRSKNTPFLLLKNK